MGVQVNIVLEVITRDGGFAISILEDEVHYDYVRNQGDQSIAIFDDKNKAVEVAEETAKVYTQNELDEGRYSEYVGIHAK